MKTNCSGCGTYHMNGWLICSSCGRTNPDVGIDNRPLLAATSPLSAVTISNDIDIKDTCVRVVDARGECEGKLLALLPPKDGAPWQMVLRVPREYVLDPLREEIKSWKKKYEEISIKLKEKDTEIVNLQSDLERSKENSDILSGVIKLEREACDKWREAARKLEHDMGKVREALGTKGLAAILESP